MSYIIAPGGSGDKNYGNGGETTMYETSNPNEAMFISNGNGGSYNTSNIYIGIRGANGSNGSNWNGVIGHGSSSGSACSDSDFPIGGGGGGSLTGNSGESGEKGGAGGKGGAFGRATGTGGSSARGAGGEGQSNAAIYPYVSKYNLICSRGGNGNVGTSIGGFYAGGGGGVEPAANSPRYQYRIRQR